MSERSALVVARLELALRHEIAARWRNVLPLGVLTLLFDVTMLVPAVLAARLYALAFVLVVPGLVLLAPTRLRPRETSTRLAWVVGSSVLTLILVGLALSYLLPPLGVRRPLAEAPLLLATNVVVIGALLLQSRRRDPLGYLLRGRTPSWRQVAALAAMLLAPVAAMAGAERLNNGGSGDVALAALAAIGGLLATAFLPGARLPAWSVRVALYAATAAVLLMSSTRSSYTYGFDIQKEFHVFAATLHAGVWHVPRDGNAYAAMLSITVLPTALTILTHVSGTYLFKELYPLLFSFFPVIVFDISARWFGRRAALFGAVLLIVQGLYAADINGLARQEVGLLYFGLFVITAFDDHLTTRVRQAGVLVSGVAMAITHYSTAYFAATVLIGGYLAYGVLRLASRRSRPNPVFSLPLVVVVVGVVVLWNAVITHSVQNIGNLVSTLNASGLQILSGAKGSSLVQRFLNADVTAATTPHQFALAAIAYAHAHMPWLHPYPPALTHAYPIASAPPSAPNGTTPAIYATAVTNATTVVAELVLLLTGVGVLLLLWSERRVRRPERAELASFALGCIALLALLRLSATISALYNAPRGQVQGAPALSVGLAFLLEWLFTRRRAVAVGSTTIAGCALALLLFSDSGLSFRTLSGGGVDTLQNYGDAYQMFYFTGADMASAQWVVQHRRPGDVVFADIYGGLQIDHYASIPGIVTAILPQLTEPGAFVYARTSNVVDGTVRAQVGTTGAIYRYPARFLSVTKDLVFTTATTRVYH